MIGIPNIQTLQDYQRECAGRLSLDQPQLSGPLRNRFFYALAVRGSHVGGVGRAALGWVLGRRLKLRQTGLIAMDTSPD